MVPQTNLSERSQQVLHFSERLFGQQPDWVTFFREVLGIDGLARRTFPSFDELTAFEHSDEYDQIQKMLVKLREQKPNADTDSEPTRVITVRLPKSMHEYLRTEAHDLRTSMNKLCISKLLQVIEQDMVPAEQSVPPKRRNTPAPGVTDRDMLPAPASIPMVSGPMVGSNNVVENGHYEFKGGF